MNEPARHTILGEIEPDTVAEFAEWHAGREQQPIVLRLNSRGGMLTSAWTIADTLNKRHTHTYAEICGACDSAATVIALACPFRQIAPTATITLHRPTIWRRPESPEQRRQWQATLDRQFERLVDYYTLKALLPRDQVEALVIGDGGIEGTTLDAEQAVAFGFAHHIDDTLPSEAAEDRSELERWRDRAFVICEREKLRKRLAAIGAS